MCIIQQLGLTGNKIGDPGITALADALGKGALPKLEWLDLQKNQIADAGVTALASAMSKGALASLETLYVDDGPLGTEHPALEAACEARGIEMP